MGIVGGLGGPERGPESARFADHDGYSGVTFDLPGTGAHLKFTDPDGFRVVLVAGSWTA